MRRGQSVSSDQQGMTSASLSERLQPLKEHSLHRQNRHPPLMQTKTALTAGRLRSRSDWLNSTTWKNYLQDIVRVSNTKFPDAVNTTLTTLFSHSKKEHHTAEEEEST